MWCRRRCVLVCQHRHQQIFTSMYVASSRTVDGGVLFKLVCARAGRHILVDELPGARSSKHLHTQEEDDGYYFFCFARTDHPSTQPPQPLGLHVICLSVCTCLFVHIICVTQSQVVMRESTIPPTFCCCGNIEQKTIPFSSRRWKLSWSRKLAEKPCDDPRYLLAHWCFTLNNLSVPCSAAFRASLGAMLYSIPVHTLSLHTIYHVFVCSRQFLSRDVV